MLMPIHVENEEERRRESPCDRSTWYINARVSMRVNSQRGKNVKCSSFTRRCVVINNNGTVNYCVRLGDVRTITGHDSHENVETYQSYRCVNIPFAFRESYFMRVNY